jgi:hypothetical protein
LLNENAEFMESKRFDDLRVEGGVLYHFFNLFDDFYSAVRMDLDRTGWFEPDPDKPFDYPNYQELEREKTMYVAELSEVVAKGRIRYVAAELDLGASYADQNDDDFLKTHYDVFCTSWWRRRGISFPKAFPLSITPSPSGGTIFRPRKKKIGTVTSTR